MNKQYKAWIIDDDKSIRWVLEKALERADIATKSFIDAQQALDALTNEKPDVVVTDIRMPGMDGLELLSRLHKEDPALPVIIMTAHSDLDSTVSSYEGGAYDYMPKPFDVNQAVELVLRACAQHKDKVKEQIENNGIRAGNNLLIGVAPAMQEVFRAIGRLSRTNATVLITGESGTGKELVAKALHRHSPRAKKTFIALNTAAIPRDLLESELFGHEKGAFTGAQSQRQGRFEQANSGTLFLDEIGDMPAELQTRLLRVLSDGTFYRVGGHAPVRVDVRIIAATHQGLSERVKKGLFREDLFHRLNVIRIRLPALRERKEDIKLLAQHFLKRIAMEMGEAEKTLSINATDCFLAYDWSGNVRELENVCRWLTVMAPGLEVSSADLPPEMIDVQGKDESVQSSWEDLLKAWAMNDKLSADSEALAAVMPRVEKILIEVALARTRGRRQEAAKLLGWGRNTLTRKIQAYQLNDDSSATQH